MHASFSALVVLVEVDRFGASEHLSAAAASVDFNP